MTIEIQARNFRGLVAADVQCAPIALVAGQNYAAKTALVQAVQAALTGEPLGSFEPELKKKDAAVLVREGSTKAEVLVMSGKENIAHLEWPQCRLFTKGAPPRATAFAAGTMSIATMPPKERLVALTSGNGGGHDYLKISPTKEDLTAALASEEFDSEVVDEHELWKLIERDGWDATHKRQTENRAKTAGQWESVTGERFGSQKSQSWRPEGWYPALEKYSEEELEQRVRTATAQLEQAIASQAVDKAQLERLATAVAQLPDLEATMETRREEKAAAEDLLLEAQQDRAALPTVPAGVGLACPHCGNLVAVEQTIGVTTLRKFEAVPEAKTKAVRDKIAAADGLWSKRQAEVAMARQAFGGAERAVLEARQAKAAHDAGAGRTGSAAAVETAREHELNARAALKAARRMAKAAECSQRWEWLQIVIDILAPGPGGLRQKKLGAGIATMNTCLAELSEIAGWKRVALTEDLVVTYGARPYLLLSKSEQLRVRAILQLAQAQLDESSMVVIDEADVLDNTGRQELLELLGECGVPALVAMTLSSPRSAPDLAEFDLGATWWMDRSGATAVPLAKAREDAAKAAATAT